MRELLLESPIWTKIAFMSMQAQLFITCLAEQFYPRTLEKMVRLLSELGVAVQFPSAQTCCGQPLFNSGYQSEARELARKWLGTFSESPAPVVSPSGSCVDMVRHHYAGLFPPGSTEHDMARELAARVKAALRRLRTGAGLPGAEVLAFRHIRIDTGSRQVWLNDKPVELTTIEFDLLTTLAEHRGRVLSREQLLEKVWGFDYYGEIRVVDVHVGHIRQKLGEEFITTVRGVGYRFDDEVVS